MEFVSPAWAIALALAWAGATDPGPSRILIAPDTPQATEAWIYRGATDGPALVLEGCIHGNERSGAYALEDLVPRLRVDSGTVLLIPRMHAPACAANRRFIEEDLNRVFPGDPAGATMEKRLAASLYSVIKEVSPRLVLTFHEARSLKPPKERSDGSKGIGSQTICTGILPYPEGLLDVVRRTNERIARADLHFAPIHYPVDGSSSEVFVAELGCEAYCVELWNRLPMDARRELATDVALAAMESLGISYRVVDPAAEPRSLGQLLRRAAPGEHVERPAPVVEEPAAR